MAMMSGPTKSARMILWSYLRCMKKPTTRTNLTADMMSRLDHQEPVRDAGDVERGHLDGGDEAEHDGHVDVGLDGGVPAAVASWAPCARRLRVARDRPCRGS